jgi:hypothetical protein
MHINDIRMNNYRAILVRFRTRPDEVGMPEHGLLRRFAAQCNISPRYLSHILHGRKKFSDAMARHIERGMALPEGWMDNVHEENTDPAERELLDLVARLYRENPVEVQRLLMHYVMARKLPAPAKANGLV